ncbi:putative RNA polymerase sigma factor FecI [Nitrospira sp. KM1]|nr:putative RNA polymerase sigma factor FecI [Nitrospira sp. KM1]
MKELRSFLTRRLGCPETAAELVQETYIRLATRQEQDPHVNPRALVFRVASNLATDHARHQSVRERFDGGTIDEDALVAPVPSPDAALAEEQERKLLKLAIAELPEKRRMVFLLRMSQELSYSEIGKRLGISVSAVEKHISKAVLHCRAHVERHRGSRAE